MRSYGNPVRTVNDRKMQALEFILCARLDKVRAETAETIAARYAVPVEFAADKLRHRLGQGW